MRERLAQQLDGLGGNARKSIPRHLPGQHSQLFDQGLAFVGQVQPPSPAILGVAATLDQAALFQPIDDPAQGDRLDIEMIGKLDLTKPRFAPHPSERPPLRTRHAKRRRATIELAPQTVGRFGNLKRNRIQGYINTYNKCTY